MTAGTLRMAEPGLGALAERLDVLTLPEPLALDSGQSLFPASIAWRSYGRLSPARDNAVLICHALTGDQFVAETHPLTGKPGWWSALVGPGKAIDTDRWFVLCANVLGGCMGSSGPASPNPATGQPWGLDFPLVTIRDMVRAQVALLDHLGIGRLVAAIGGSMGGMQVLALAAGWPERVARAIPIATSFRHSAQNIAFHEVGRQAIMADPVWNGGRYWQNRQVPRAGLSVARMTAHVTYLSETALHRKFGRALQDRTRPTYGFEADFQVESYLRHQGSSFVERFDANSYLYITRAMDYFDLAEACDGHLARAFDGASTRFCVVSFSSDWLFPTSESRILVNALNAAGCEVSFTEIESDKGHDAFLLEEPDFEAVIRGFLASEGAHAPSVAPELGRSDLRVIARMVPAGARVLDVGCADGTLLAHLKSAKGVTARGLEVDRRLVAQAVARGVPVVQGKAEKDLSLFADDAFDVAILSLTLQALKRPELVLSEMSRIARSVIVSFVNAGYWWNRREFLLSGRMPLAAERGHGWWDTPDIHDLTIRDFLAFAGRLGLSVAEAVVLDRHGRPMAGALHSRRANWLGRQAVVRLLRA